MRANSTLYSLRLRAISVAILIILVLISFQFFYIAPREQALDKENLLAESRNTLRQVATQLVSPILKREFASVYELIDTQLEVNNYWRGVRIVDTDGKQLYPLSTWADTVAKGEVLLRQDIAFLDEPIGAIELAVNYTEAFAASRELRNQLAFFQFLVLFVALAGAYVMFERLVVRPLSQLSKAFAGMAAGQFDYPLPEATTGEIGALVRDFRSARSTVATYQANLKTLKEEADQANMAKSQFLSRMSHELRTPLNAIIGFSELCLEEPGATESGRAPLHAINKSGHHLLTLIDEILELTRIEAGLTRIDIKSLPLHDILDDCRMFIGNLATSNGIALNFSSLPEGCSHVFADSTRLKQCILNLLSNAIKYNRAGGAVTVTCLKAAPGRVRIAISDEGPGLDDDQVERVFRPFERLAMHADSTEGTGIGLGITRQLVIMMGGAIGVDRNAGPGSTFWIELPEAGDAAIAGVSAEPEPAFIAPEFGQRASEGVSDAPASLAGAGCGG
jgi:two-component system, sensor histidine kinase